MSLIKCNPNNYQCGKICISKTKKCHKVSSVYTSNVIDNFYQLVGRDNSGAREFYENLPIEDKKIFEQNVGIFSEDYKAWGIQQYLSERYSLMNKYLYDEGYRKEAPPLIKYSVEAAMDGFKELPNYPKETIINHYKKKGVNYDGETLYRGMFSPHPDIFNDFITSHIEGSTVEYSSFTSTSVANPDDSKSKKVDGSWGTKPLQIKIIQKNGTSGRWVDNLKRTKDEGEILFPPGQKFKVLKNDIKYQDRLPPNYDLPLLEIFKSSSEGFGLNNLTLNSLLGGLSSNTLLTSSHFQEIRGLLRKRGLPPPTQWTNSMKIGDLLSLSKLKGGKSKFYEMASKALIGELLERNIISKDSLKKIAASSEIILQEI